MSQDLSILAIDPGNTHSAVCLYDCAADKPVRWEKIANDEVLDMIRRGSSQVKWDVLVVEAIASYGMPVGAEVFDTVFWTGRFCEAQANRGGRFDRLYRREVKMHLCGSMRAKDANIRQRLIDIFGAPGTKKAPGVLYGMSGDCWAALAVAVTAADKMKGKVR